MKKNMTEVVFILDRSGSMSGLESDTIGGFNSMLKKQRKEVGQVVVTTVLFDDRYELFHDRMDLHKLSEMTDKDYFVRGSTALLDAIGWTIKKVSQTQKEAPKNQKADKVLFVIITDGLENASREFSPEKVKHLISKKKSKGWEFLFLGANIDAVKTASSYGISADRAANYHSDQAGTALNFEVVSAAVSSYRKGKALKRTWKEEIDKEFVNRQ